MVGSTGRIIVETKMILGFQLGFLLDLKFEQATIAI